jgi:hypothetical protein
VNLSIGAQIPTITLMEALKNGQTLMRKYPNKEVETLRRARTKTGSMQYIRAGWSSKVGTVEEVLCEIRNNPELWSVVSSCDVKF